MAMEYQGTGRVRLAAFYSASLSGHWQFSESQGYLKTLGALDTTNPQEPVVIIPNYIGGQSNCVGASRYHDPAIEVVGTPTVVVGPAVVVIGTPSVVVGPAVEVVGNPTVVVGPAVEVVGTPSVVVGPAVGVVGTPTVVVGPAVEVVGTPT